MNATHLKEAHGSIRIETESYCAAYTDVELKILFTGDYTCHDVSWPYGAGIKMEGRMSKV